MTKYKVGDVVIIVDSNYKHSIESVNLNSYGEHYYKLKGCTAKYYDNDLKLPKDVSKIQEIKKGDRVVANGIIDKVVFINAKGTVKDMSEHNKSYDIKFDDSFSVPGYVGKFNLWWCKHNFITPITLSADNISSSVLPNRLSNSISFSGDAKNVDIDRIEYIKSIKNKVNLEGFKMNLEYIKKENITKAVAFVNKDLANDEQKYVALKYREFVDAKNQLDRSIMSKKNALKKLIEDNVVFKGV